jgi:phospholipid/cholesterol/gamma-HCH transport system substrate-binding protein
METKANYTLIGLFTIAVIVAVAGFVWWFQHAGSGAQRAYYRVLFESSVSGLRTGSAVLFNGIRVGEVESISLSADNPKQVIATISVDDAVKVRPDTRAGVEFQGLTGIAAVALSGGSADKPPLKGSRQNPPTLDASAAATQDVTQGAREVLQRIDDLILENRGALRNALRNMDIFTDTLAKNSQRIENVLTGLENLAGGPDGKGGDINEAARSIRSLADKLNNETAADLSKLLTNLDKRTDSLVKEWNELANTGTRQIDLISRDLRRTLADIDRTVNNIDKNPSRLIWGGGTPPAPPPQQGGAR